MEIKEGAKYVILINSADRPGKLLTYIAIINSQDSMFLTFTDIKNKTFTFNKNVIVSLTPFDENYKKEGNGDGD